MRSLVTLLLVAATFASGCAFLPTECPQLRDVGVLVPLLDGAHAQRDPVQPWQTVVLPFGNGTASVNASVAAPASLEPVAPGASLLRLSVPPATEATLNWTAHQAGAECSASRSGGVAWDFMGAEAGTVAAAGMGARVWYAGFWENGTMFDTNLPDLHLSAWPRAAWYDAAIGAPLPVYIYDQDRAERSPIWAPGTSGTPAGPATGNAAPLWSYYTTIQGFNDGLKGLSTTTTRVVWMPAEAAYGGRTDVPAGLDAPLVFLVKLAAVERLPCSSDLEACGIPVATRPVPPLLVTPTR